MGKQGKSRVYLGIDPASNGFAYTILRGRVYGGAPLARYVASKKIAVSDHRQFTQSFTELLNTTRVSRVGIEVPGQFGGSGFESSYLISSAIQIGILVQILSQLKIPCVLYPAQVNRKQQVGLGWRYYQFGKGGKRKNRVQWDDAVKSFLTDHDNIVDYPGRTSKDVRDSSLIAYTLYMAEIKNELDLLGVVNPCDYHEYLKKSRN
jgi:Holliday junction resolvasome RuvABC endonuclease subunit